MRHSNIALTKKMLAYAAKHKIPVGTVSTVLPAWGNGKRELAWRVSGHLSKDPKSLVRLTATHSPALDAYFFPEKERVKIIEERYNWSVPPLKRTGRLPGIVWHHSAGAGSPQEIHRLHLQIGDRGIAYHFYVRKNGLVYRGRPENTMGAHCLGHNDWIGVCAEGNYDTTRTMPDAQLKSLKLLHTELHGKYRVRDMRHKDMSGNSTACPGRYFPFHVITV